MIAAALARGLRLVTAESCTAGALATLLADAPDAGKVFVGGFGTYSTASKEGILGVSEDLIGRETAVSAKVATDMARGALRSTSAGLAVAVTGVAGPAPDEDGNEVGLTYIACARSEGTIRTERHVFCETSREQIRARQLEAALKLMLKVLGEADAALDRA